MRIYTSCLEAVDEVERDLWEMGVEVRTHSMQDKVIEDNPDFYTKELSPYMFQVTKPWDDINQFLIHFAGGSSTEIGRAMTWAEMEFGERVQWLIPINPGEAWKTRGGVWKEFLHEGKFAYTYNERIRTQLVKVVKELENHPGTRQAIIEIHNNEFDLDSMGGVARVPCSMHYQFLIRQDKVDLIYVMRSSDFLTHFGYDNWLAIRLQKYMADTLERKIGRYTFMTGSLHAYYKDLKAKGIF